MNESQDYKNFIKEVRNRCKNNGVKFFLSKRKTLKVNGVHVNGYFLSNEGEEILAVATGKPMKDWFHILIHEYCHMMQWEENTDLWRKVESLNALARLDDWTNDLIELSKVEIDEIVNSIMDLEKDCEKRVVELIKKYNFPIDIEDYIKKANSYILFYHMVKKYRNWGYDNKKPYNIKEVYSKMPSTFNYNHHILTKEQEEILFLAYL